MRGRPVYLHMRKNKWWDKSTGKIFSYNLDLPNEEGTRLSAEFGTFLKVPHPQSVNEMRRTHSVRA